MRSTFCIVLLFSVCCTVSADPCESQDTCSKCITNPNCVWCAKGDYEGIRCKSLNSKAQKQCPNDLQNIHSTQAVIRNDDFTSSSKNVIQIVPQAIKLNLRVGEPTNFIFKYKQAENYPVDLYFLLDVSNSMKNIRDTLMKQSQDVYNVMKTFTSIIRLGIGTFVDKNTFPFANDPQKKEVYSFRNQLPLTDNVSLFHETLRNTKFIQNFDIPEGGLDALGQVLACSNGTENIIGWSPHSRKIVLFITDDQYHAAGDGLIAGIQTPYDGQCYTASDGVYKKELEMDYPSVAMIKKLANKIGAIIIFVAKNSVESIYSDLADAVYGKSEAYSVQESVDENTKFDKILKEVYEEKTKTIALITSNLPKTNDLYEIKFTPDCSKREFTSNAESDNACTVKFYEEKPIIGTITLKKYDENVRNFSIEILIDGLNERLKLDVEVITNCKCEATVIKKAPECNYNGDLECGLCNCDKNWFGPQCNCTQDYDREDDFASCKRNDDDKICSGNGDCICGACICHRPGNEQKYSGKYCQCDSDSCPRKNNTICSNHGRCQCGVCACDKSWTGHACDISTLKTNCIKNNKECNDRGKCYNNACDCEALPEWDERKTNMNSLCAIVPDTSVHNRQCKALEALVLCTYNGKDSCAFAHLESMEIRRIEKVSNENSSWNVCDDVRVGVGCYIHFSYMYHDENRTIELLIEEKANCQQNYYMFGGITFATLILAGLCTLVSWKVLTTMRDRREYEQFLASNKRQSSIRKNVLYTSPNSTIQNPAYVED